MKINDRENQFLCFYLSIQLLVSDPLLQSLTRLARSNFIIEWQTISS